MFRPNRLRARLNRGEPSLGAWLFGDSPTNAEILGLAGFDAVLIDREHGAAGFETCIAAMRAIRSAGDSTILVRAAANEPSELKRLLDSGAEGILLANIESAEEAQRAVAACRYPPAGKRGLHYTVSRAAGWGTDADAYAREIERNLLLVAMIESAAGVEAIDAIAAVDGIDMLFVGPLDLSASVGLAGQYAHPTIEALLARFEARTLAAGKLLGGASWPGQDADALFRKGYRFVTSASDVGLLRDAALAASRAVARPR